jgi:hypothetical protein
MNENLTLTIKKAKIADDTFLETEYLLTEADGDDTVSTEIASKSRKIIHEDLKKAFNRLIPHLVMLAEIVDDENVDRYHFDTEEIYQDPRFDKFRVTGFSLGGNDEHSGVTIIGRKMLRGKKVLNLTTPFTKFDPETEQSGYHFLRELYIAVDLCEQEVQAYINGKHAPNPQLELDIN